MKRFIYFFVLCQFMFCIHCFAQPAKVAVGVINLEIMDSSRSNWLGTGPRPLRSIVWYPAANGGIKEVVSDAEQFVDPVTFFHGARISKQKSKYPLIVISHGSQGNAKKMQWLGSYLASKGFIAVAVSHNGTDKEELRNGGLTLSDFCMWERPKDVSRVIDEMLQNKFFSPKIDTSKMAVAGFSLGGTTAIWAAGAAINMDRLAEKEGPVPDRYRYDIDRFTAFVRENPVGINSVKHHGELFKDVRLKAVFALAPAIGQAFDQKGLENIRVPVQIVTGNQDKVNPMSQNAEHFAKYIPFAKPLIVLPGERGHYTMPGVGKERAAGLQEVAQLSVNFFAGVFKLTN